MLKLAVVACLILLSGVAAGCDSDGAGVTTPDESDEHRPATSKSLTPVPRGTTTPSITVKPADAAIGGILKLQRSAKGLSDRMILIKSQGPGGDNMIPPESRPNNVQDIYLRGNCGASFIEIRDERLWPERYRELLDELKAVCESLLAVDADIKDVVIEFEPQFTALYETVAADTYEGIVAEVEARTTP
jgi:hypothetical protein